MLKVVTKSDKEIHKDVLGELQWDMRIDETDVGVEVDDGVVTLSGTVDSWAKKVAAEEAAHRVSGVLDVANDVVVRPPGMPGWTDAEIAHAVRHALEWNVFVPHQRIKSTVRNGTVTLEGDVDHWYQRDSADRAVRNLAGVNGVVGLITVYPPKAKQADVRKAIEDALARRAANEARGVDVQVQNGRVTLSGVVPTWSERAVVVQAAQSTAGVREVETHLRVEPPL